jgi:hypothetical protein
MAKGICSDCGNETAGGIRCKNCWGKEVARRALIETAERDRELLRMVEEDRLEGQSGYHNGGTRLAARLGVSHVRGIEKIRLARQRTKRREELGITA